LSTATVFIAYSHKDLKFQEDVSIHIKALGMSGEIVPWSDRQISGGEDWFEKIESAISKAKIAILIISAHFLASDFIKKVEIPKLLKRCQTDGLILIPVLARHCAWEPVAWLSKIQFLPGDNIALQDLRGSNLEKALSKIANQVNQHLATEKSGDIKLGPQSYKSSTFQISVPSSTFPNLLPIGGLPLPCFFPSVSSAAKSTLNPLDHLKILVRLKYPCFLVSVFDFAKAKREDRSQMSSLMNQAIKNGQIVLLDSGLYEKRWSRNGKWLRSEYYSTAKSVPCHFGFFYDDISVRQEDDSKEIAIRIAKRVKNDRRKIEVENIYPIIHNEGELNLEELCHEVVKVLDPAIIAIAERELGDGILEGAKKMIEIRRAVNAANENVCIHLLGTGNPLSLLIYAACGADTFDGLDRGRIFSRI